MRRALGIAAVSAAARRDRRGCRGVRRPRESGGVWRVIRQLVRDEGSRAVPRGEVALGMELVEGQERRRPRHAEVRRERARRRQARPGTDDAFDDRPPDARADLLLQIAAPAPFDAQQQARRRWRSQEVLLGVGTLQAARPRLRLIRFGLRSAANQGAVFRFLKHVGSLGGPAPWSILWQHR